jgi:hypothetical protein
MKILASALLALMLSSAAVRAQGFVGQNAADTGDDKAIRVTISVQVMTPMDENAATTDLAATLTQANQPLSGIIGQQCAVLATALKGTCKLVQLNMGSNIGNRFLPPLQPGGRADRRQMVDGNVNATFVIEPATSK